MTIPTLTTEAMYPEPKGKLRSVTNWVSVLVPVLTGILTLVGVPIPGDALAPLLVSVAQGIATLWARNRKGGGGATVGK